MSLKDKWNKFIHGDESEKETEFLPAILEVTETPPSPTGRIIMWSILALLVVAILWSCIGTINEVAIAPGKVIPAGQVKTIQVKNKGVIKKINVAEGQYVKEGDVLVELDPTTASADFDSLSKRAAYYQLDIKRLEAELNGTPFMPSPDEKLDAEDIAAEISLYNSRVSQYRSEAQAAQMAVDQKRSALSAEQANYAKYSEVLDITQEKENRLKTLVQENAIAEFQLLEQTSQRVQYEKTAQAQLDIIARTEAELAEALSRQATVDATYKKDVMDALVESRKQYYAYVEEIKKAEENQRLSTIVAPCDGRVYNLAVHTEGGIVTDAQPLMIIVPDDKNIPDYRELEIEAWADNKDIGFLQVGQEAEVKVSTFNFQKYGMVKATVREIAADAYDDKTDPMKDKRYRLLLAINEGESEGLEGSISPGMDVSAEVKIKEKRIIEFFLDPFRTYTHEALRER